MIIPIRFLWLTLLAASSTSSAYVKYACGVSFLPPRYPLKDKCYHTPTRHLVEEKFDLDVE
jgi:hypothetical protein